MTPHIVSARRAVWPFGLGGLAVTAGVITHLARFLMTKSMDRQPAARPINYGMLWLHRRNTLPITPLAPLFFAPDPP